jgi:hypothetical protein
MHYIENVAFYKCCGVDVSMIRTGFYSNWQAKKNEPSSILVILNSIFLFVSMKYVSLNLMNKRAGRNELHRS